ncbi:putative glycosyltransferase, partial [Trifolium pratense]
MFYSSLQNSSYLTQQPQQAHLFFLPFSSNISTRSLARLVSRIRKEFPYWNRSLGADHFYLSCAGISNSNDRNIVELKKNAVQITCFPTRCHSFVPHKDITLPPVINVHAPFKNLHAPVKLGGGGEFCVVEYGNSEVLWIGEAMRLGCVPVVVTEGTMNDMPFMDVLKWKEMAVFVKSDVKNVTWRERHQNMRRLGVVARKHLRWNRPSLPFDAFNTVMFQLWLRRHTNWFVSRLRKTVGDGKETFFKNDPWIIGNSLRSRFPRLSAVATSKDGLVAMVLKAECVLCRGWYVELLTIWLVFLKSLMEQAKVVEMFASHRCNHHGCGRWRLCSSLNCYDQTLPLHKEFPYWNRSLHDHVPVKLAGEGTVNGMPFMDVLKWEEMAVFVKSDVKHLRWNRPPLPFDAFNTVMYQLWLRRHTNWFVSRLRKTVGDGKETFFKNDPWIIGNSLRSRFPRLSAVATSKDGLVAMVLKAECVLCRGWYVELLTIWLVFLKSLMEQAKVVEMFASHRCNHHGCGRWRLCSSLNCYDQTLPLHKEFPYWNRSLHDHVPVKLAGEGTVNGMPFMDVLKWEEMAVFVKSDVKHLRWNRPPLPFDAFNTVMYQLWLRRHTVRYE